MSLFTRYLSRDDDVTYFFTANCTRWVDLSSTIKTTQNYSFVAIQLDINSIGKATKTNLLSCARFTKQPVNIQSSCARNRMNYSPYNAAARKKSET